MQKMVYGKNWIVKMSLGRKNLEPETYVVLV